MAAGHGKGSVGRFISKDGEEALPSLAKQAVHSSATRQPVWPLCAHQGEEFRHQDLRGDEELRSQEGPVPVRGGLTEGPPAREAVPGRASGMCSSPSHLLKLCPWANAVSACTQAQKPHLQMDRSPRLPRRPVSTPLLRKYLFQVDLLV